MIPVRLELKNFLPYRSPDALRFDGIHLACLTGPNGAGKSSLLDAITWALWGHARAKRDEELIHLGQSDMYVQLDFEQEGVMWRVLRRRSGGKRGQGTLDLFIIHPDGSKVLQSENAVRQTQDKINRILRLDYETFIHSAFLQQGKADAFTTRTPAQRKQILSDILGLDQWTRYEDQVKEKLKAITSQLIYFDERIKEIDEELARKPSLEAQLKEATKTHEEAQIALAAAEERLKEVEHAPGDLRSAYDAKTERERRLREHQRDLESAGEQITRYQQQIADYQTVLAAQEEIESGYAALQNAREADQSFSDMLRQLKTLDGQHYELRSQLDAARTRLQSEAENTQRRIAELEDIIQTDLTADLESVQAEVQGLQDRETERDHLKEQENRLREQRAEMESLRKTLEAEGKSTKDRVIRLEQTDDPICPLCGQPLDQHHRQQLIAQLNQEVDDKREAYKQNQEAAAAIAEELAQVKTQVSGLDSELKRLSPLIERVGVLQAQSEAVRQAQIRLEEEYTHLTIIQNELTEETFASDIRQQLEALEAVQAELGYDENTHDDTRQQIEAHMHYEQMKTRLSVAQGSLPAIEESLAGAHKRQHTLEEAMSTTHDEINALDGEIARLQVLMEEYTAREIEVRTQRTRERGAYERLVSAEQSLKSLEAQAARKTELEARRIQARYDEALYDQLKRAFGKNGIPAMIIETAIPELEAESNDLLSRMTDGRMHLKLNTQREKITGGMAETLDIEIADELGTRAYELYSGGEAFRIDFAVRVALSKMLARRAGAHLRTLFIDEGFGTQDDAGRNKLVEAITAIQEDFDLILVITHIDELRDHFPVHIVVDKTGQGSAVSIR